MKRNKCTYVYMYTYTYKYIYVYIHVLKHIGNLKTTENYKNYNHEQASRQATGSSFYYITDSKDLNL